MNVTVTRPTNVMWGQVSYLPVLQLPLEYGRVRNLPPHQIGHLSVTSTVALDSSMFNGLFSQRAILRCPVHVLRFQVMRER